MMVDNISTDVSEIDKLIEKAVPFLAYSLPGESIVRICDEKDTHEVAIGLFGAEAQIITLEDTCADVDALNPYLLSTDYDDYISGVNKEIGRLRREGGKTVLSRIISGAGRLNVDHLFHASDPHSFRFVFYTPFTGLWAGASPELLLKQSVDGTLTTMALAGT